MPIGTSDGKMYENEFDMLLGNHKSDINETETSKKPVISAQPERRANFEITPDQPEGRHIFLIRHGATALNGEDNNSVDKIRGWSDVPLSDQGREEAKTTAANLKDKGITAIVASNLGRAKETADIIGKEIGVDPTYKHELRPWDLGKFTGTSTKEAIPKLREYSTSKQDEKVPEGESFNDFKSRAFSGVSQAIQDHPNDNLAIVTHHRVERLLHAWNEAGQPEDGSIHDPTFLQKGEAPGSYTELNISDKIHSMTHQAEKPNPAAPYIDAIKKFAEGGISKVLGDNQPEWSKKLGEKLSSPEANAALGVFGGLGAKTANMPKYWTARTMESTGKDAREIYDKTGWYKDVDQEWKHFIPEEGYKLKEGSIGYERTKQDEPTSGWLSVGTSTNNDDKITIPFPTKLSTIIDHPKLFEAYPEAKNIRIEPETNPDYLGSFNPTTNTIRMTERPEADFKSTLIHELQHWIQEKEGFAKGSNPSMHLPENMQTLRGLLRDKEDYLYNYYGKANLLGGKSFYNLKFAVKDDLRGTGLVIKEDKELLEASKREHTEAHKEVELLVRSENILDMFNEEAKNRYRRSAGEVESRNAQLWSEATDFKDSYPWETKKTPGGKPEIVKK